MKTEKLISYSCAVLLIVSSIVLAFVQVLDINDVASGTLMYIAQAFLLAGSIFGLDYYIQKLTAVIIKKEKTPKATAIVACLLLMTPAVSNAQLIHVSSPAFTAVYDLQTNCPQKVTWRLHDTDLGSVRRSASWRFVTDIFNPYGSPAHSDFVRSGYDRGHCCPAADRSASSFMMRSTFVMSNVAAQMPSLNRGAWLISEDSCRRLALRYDSIDVLVVPVFLPRDTFRLANGRIAVPHGFFKSAWISSTDSVIASWFFFNK